MRYSLLFSDFCLKVGILAVSLPIISSAANAQIREDDTLPRNSQIRQERNRWVITEGTRRENNLFHSFEEFSIPNGDTASFQEINQNIDSVFVRVTGDSHSNINGTIETLQSSGDISPADFFLLNPNGILFGPNARLNIGGSFLATSADSIIFEDGALFGAVDPQESPLLTVSTPVGLQFGRDPGAIANQSIAQNFDSTGDVLSDLFGSEVLGLRVLSGETLALIGGPITLDGGWVVTGAGAETTGPGGRIELTSVWANEFVNLISNPTGWRLGVAEVENFDDIRLSQSAIAYGENGEAIVVNGRTVSLESGSQIYSITQGRDDGEPLTVNASDQLILTGFFDQDSDSAFFENIDFRSTLTTITIDRGSAGDIQISTRNLRVANAAFLGSDTVFGRGSSGNLLIDSVESVDVVGAFSTVTTLSGGLGEGRGAVGDIEIFTGDLNIRGGGEVSSVTSTRRRGGDIIVNASDLVSVIGITTDPDLSNDFRGGILSTQTDAIEENAGRAGDLTVITNQLVLKAGGQISTSTFGGGDAGVLEVMANDISITGVAVDDSGEPFRSSRQDGRLPYPSGLFAGAAPNSTGGDGGLLSVDADRLSLRDGGVLQTNTFSSGNAGNMRIRVTDFIEMDGVSPDGGIPTSITALSGGLPDSAFRNVPSATGNGGDIQIETGDLRLSNGAVIVTSSINPDAAGAGQIRIQADSIALNNNAQLNARTESGQGEATIDLRGLELLTLQGESTITTEAGLENNGGSGGDIEIRSEYIIAEPLNDNDIAADAGVGDGGNITIVANIFGLIQQDRPTSPESGITASSEQGVSGTITVTEPDVDPTRGLVELPAEVVDASRLVASSCRPSDPSDPFSEFVITGRGGLPQSPMNSRQNDAVQSSWVTRSTQTASTVSLDSPESLETSATSDSIIEVQGWLTGEDGAIMLTAQAPTTTPHSAPLFLPNCNTW